MSLFASLFLARRARFALGGLFTSQGLRHQVIGEHQLCVAHLFDRKQYIRFLAVRHVVAMDARGVTFSSRQLAAKTLAAIDRNFHLDLDQMARIAFEIRFSHQWPVNAWREISSR